ncbi:MAG: hypothetical protein KDA96_09175 [Planctomycetaceae bacterium]|nr:hypothetical protein [Planctomycetaceae bacterium]
MLRNSRNADDVVRCVDGPNCFVAGTQIVVAVNVEDEAVDAGELPLTALEEKSHRELDAYFAIGAFVTAGILAGDPIRFIRKRRRNRSLKARS